MRVRAANHSVSGDEKMALIPKPRDNVLCPVSIPDDKRPMTGVVLDAQIASCRNMRLDKYTAYIHNTVKVDRSVRGTEHVLQKRARLSAQHWNLEDKDATTTELRQQCGIKNQI